MPSFASDKEELKRQIERYFLQNAAKWREFVAEFRSVSTDVPVLALAKFFVIRSNQPFDMSAYMKAQADHIKAAFEADLDSIPPSERQRLVADWLRRNAQSHRDQIILEQARHIDDCYAEIEPYLRGLLEEPPLTEPATQATPG